MRATRAKNQFPLSSVPEDIREQEVYPLSSLRTLGLLARTSSQYEADTAFVRLLPAAIHAAPVLLDANENKENKEDATELAAIALLKKHPGLSFDKRLVTDHLNRKFFASAYQVFLGAGDIWALRQIHKDILPDVENGAAKAEADFKEQFPNCPWPPPENLSEEMLYDDRNKQQIAEIKEQLAAVKLLIDTDPFTDHEPQQDTKTAVETLCGLFQPKPGEIIKSGLHFPPAILKEVYETYNALACDWTYFSQAVLKPALDALSTVDAQCCQSGLKDLDMEKGPSRRCHPSYDHALGKPLSLRFINKNYNAGKPAMAVFVDPYDGKVRFASTRAGYFDCFDKNGELSNWAMVALAGFCQRAWGGDASCWENLWRTKAEAYGSYYAAVRRAVNTLSH